MAVRGRYRITIRKIPSRTNFDAVTKPNGFAAHLGTGAKIHFPFLSSCLLRVGLRPFERFLDVPLPIFDTNSIYGVTRKCIKRFYANVLKTTSEKTKTPSPFNIVYDNIRELRRRYFCKPNRRSSSFKLRLCATRNS